MESLLIKDAAGIGKWILILGCPLAERHSLFDPVQNASGPTFAVCACCEFQEGRDFQFFDSSGEFPIEVFPDLLIYGTTETGKILHVQCSIEPVWIITVYNPTLRPEAWDVSFKRRR